MPRSKRQPVGQGGISVSKPRAAQRTTPSASLMGAGPQSIPPAMPAVDDASSVTPRAKRASRASPKKGPQAEGRGVASAQAADRLDKLADESVESTALRAAVDEDDALLDAQDKHDRED